MRTQECLLPDPSERLGGPPRAPAPSAVNPRARRELLLFLILLACGLFVVPLLIWVVGQWILGPYADGGAFALLMDFFTGLKNGSLTYWAVVVGPYLFVLILRLFWHLIRLEYRQ
jgi:hypothetical protein